jgi:hypothetical protein
VSNSIFLENKYFFLKETGVEVENIQDIPLAKRVMLQNKSFSHLEHTGHYKIMMQSLL